MKKIKLVHKMIIAGVMIAFFMGLYLFIPAVQENLNTMVRLLSTADMDGVIEYIRSFGIWAVAVSFFLMMFQSVAAPLPAFVITFANAAVFGWWQGAILSWTSSMAGAAMCFYIAKFLGRDTVEKLTSKFAMAQVDGFFDRYGKHAILICRLLPFVSFDFVSYGAGLTSMKFIPFFIATGIGQLPATIVYSYVGGMLTGGVQMVVTALLLMFALSVLIVLFKKMYKDRKKDGNEDA